MSTPLDECHGSGIAHPWAQLGNPGVATLTVRMRRRDLVDHFASEFLFLKQGDQLATGVKIPALAEGDQAVGKRLEGLGLGQRCPDPAMLDEAAKLVGEKRVPVRSVTLELCCLSAMSHDQFVF